jgi:hypothetical protein
MLRPHTLIVSFLLTCSPLVAAQPVLSGPWTGNISKEKLHADVTKLANFGTRHTLSDVTSPTRGIGAAREWIKLTLEERGVPNVSLEWFNLPPGVRVPAGATVVNVVAVVPGTDATVPQRAYYVVGHYDSRNGDAMDAVNDSPGANDDASGTAVVMQLAEIVAKRPLESTVVFLATAGEEQGLLGAKAHAQNAASRSSYIISGVLSNDIVGDPASRSPADNAWPQGIEPSEAQRKAAQGPDARTVVRVFSEGVPRSQSAQEAAGMRALSAESDSSSRQLARFIAYVAGREVTRIAPVLIFRPDRFLRGGDHSAFNESGYAAVRFTTLNEEYSRQHANIIQRNGKPYGDTAEWVDAEYLANVAELNLATLVHLANAPAVPTNISISTKELSPSTLLAWDASPQGDVAGYEVVWRSTTSPDWEHVVDVGLTRSLTLPISKDNNFFGVRAYDQDSYRSPVGFAR